MNSFNKMMFTVMAEVARQLEAAQKKHRGMCEHLEKQKAEAGFTWFTWDVMREIEPFLEVEAQIAVVTELFSEHGRELSVTLAHPHYTEAEFVAKMAKAKETALNFTQFMPTRSSPIDSMREKARAKAYAWLANTMERMREAAAVEEV